MLRSQGETSPLPFPTISPYRLTGALRWVNMEAGIAADPFFVSRKTIGSREYRNMKKMILMALIAGATTPAATQGSEGSFTQEWTVDERCVGLSGTCIPPKLLRVSLGDN